MLINDCLLDPILDYIRGSGLGQRELQIIFGSISEELSIG